MELSERVADVVRQGRLRWFGHLNRKDYGEWMYACKNVFATGARGRGLVEVEDLGRVC